ncbi:hypothetical protein BKH42_09010 [Helicobacter sp. 13S00482-2]|uniref:hypothetical protein n=1 Tax=Helicobacter sp. 13S00482-2 TaxID=1476200 RepID=UPI000BA5FA4B|nr:hypothetical protein [Helicobacter sp. 13S00482-2]PAF52889.1 hypothetical protein BKH42_09010 [Helicobacter sp. 13S00482-2]
MRIMDALEERFKYVKFVSDLDEVIDYDVINHIMKCKGVYNFIQTVEFLRVTFEHQVDNFDDFLEYAMFLILKDEQNGCRVGTEIKKDPINTLLDGTIIDYNLDHEKNARVIVDSWNRSLQMYPVKKIGDANYCKLSTLSIFIPRYACV